MHDTSSNKKKGQSSLYVRNLMSFALWVCKSETLFLLISCIFFISKICSKLAKNVEARMIKFSRKFREENFVNVVWLQKFRIHSLLLNIWNQFLLSKIKDNGKKLKVTCQFLLLINKPSHLNWPCMNQEKI